MKLRNIKLFALASALVAMLAGCDRPFEMDLPLAVNSRLIELDKESGSTHVMVYSTGAWTAHLTENVTWASLNKLSGEGNSDLVFNYSANYGVARKVGIVLETAELKDTIFVKQKGSVTEPSFLFTNTAVGLVRSSASVRLPLTTNLQYGLENIQYKVTYDEEIGDPDDEDFVAPTNIDRWISDIVVTKSSVTFNVKENTTDEPRVAYIRFEVYDATIDGSNYNTTVTVTQGIADPVFVLEASEGVYQGYAGEYTVIATNNNIWPYYHEAKIDIEYTGEVEPWVKSAKITSDGLVFSLLENETEASRQVKLTVSYADKLGNEVSAEYAITQKVFPKPIEFSEVRAMSEGKIGLPQYIEGFIISDYNSKNICPAPQTAQFKYDFTENDKTAYIESVDGRYGFCLKFATEADAQIARYSKVKLALENVSLKKELNPDRYYITGVTAADFIEIATGSAPVKTKSITELTDDDIFTLVSVPDLEIVYKDGCFTNCTDGYSLKCDANPFSGIAGGSRWCESPLMMIDSKGNTINMVTNCSVPWRRDGKDKAMGTIVPQGTGTFKGIVVAEPMVRYGDVGRYQLRAMVKEDIALTGAPTYKTIVEWNWNDWKADTAPEVGAGTLTNVGTTAAASDFNNTYNGRDGDGGNGGATSNQKGLINNAAIKFTKQWWDNTNNVGSYFDVNFSTAGVSGSKMFFGIVWGHGAMGNTTLDSPAHWKLLYSVDGGATFNDVPDCPIITNRSIVWWTTTTQDATPGFKENVRLLPSDCFGKENVVVRVQVADKVADDKGKNAVISDDSWATNFGIEKGTIGTVQTSGQEIRIGTITVRYN